MVGFFRYYISSRHVRAESAFSLEETKKRLLALNDNRDVCIRIDQSGQLHMFATSHVGASRGTPIVPELRAKFRDHSGHVALDGQLGLNPGTQLVVTSFLLILVVLEFVPGKEAFPGALLMAIGFAFLFLVAGYVLARQDVNVISRRLAEAMGRPPTIS
jgi:hypothetical protein